MNLEISVNGEPAQVFLEGTPTWQDLLAALEADLGPRGWNIESVAVDDVPATTESCSVDLVDGQHHRIEIQAVPTPEAVEALSRELHESLPRFQTELVRLGQAFGRGEWRTAAEGLTPILDELTVVLSGILMIQEAGSPVTPGATQELLGRLEELSGHIERRSWVEVSDLLLYELVPLLEHRVSGA